MAGRQGGRPAGRQASWRAGRQAGRPASWLAGKQAGRLAGWQAGRQADRQADRQTDRQTGRGQELWDIGTLGLKCVSFYSCLVRRVDGACLVKTPQHRQFPVSIDERCVSRDIKLFQVTCHVTLNTFRWLDHDAIHTVDLASCNIPREGIMFIVQ